MSKCSNGLFPGKVIFEFLIELEIKYKLKHWLEYEVHGPSKYQSAFQLSWVFDIKGCNWIDIEKCWKRKTLAYLHEFFLSQNNLWLKYLPSLCPLCPVTPEDSKEIPVTLRWPFMSLLGARPAGGMRFLQTYLSIAVAVDDRHKETLEEKIECFN